MYSLQFDSAVNRIITLASKGQSRRTDAFAAVKLLSSISSLASNVDGGWRSIHSERADSRLTLW